MFGGGEVVGVVWVEVGSVEDTKGIGVEDGVIVFWLAPDEAKLVANVEGVEGFHGFLLGWGLGFFLDEEAEAFETVPEKFDRPTIVIDIVYG
jgi:hypothetical protein